MNMYKMTSYKACKNFKPEHTKVCEDLKFLQQRSRESFDTYS